MEVMALVLMLIGGINACSPRYNSEIYSPAQLMRLNRIYSDTCEETRCGDKCLQYLSHCICGQSQILFRRFRNQYCCIPSDENCKIKIEKQDIGLLGTSIVNCSQGEKIPMSSHCKNTQRSLQCYNSYQDSLGIGYDSHFTCPHTCVSVHNDMCRGVNWCEDDVKMCGPQLRCAEDEDYKVKLQLSTNVTPDHYYCVKIGVSGSLSATIHNNGLFDSFDRSDETLANVTEGTSYDIDPDQFGECSFGDGGLGTGLDNYTGMICGIK